MLKILLSLSGLLLLSVDVCRAQQSETGVPADFRRFAQQYCADCHANGASEGGLAVDGLKFDLSDAATFAAWERIFDRIRTGEMPPADAQQPAADERLQIQAVLQSPLVAAHQKAKGTVLRRLNRREYQNTLNDLFGTQLDLVSLLPEDGRAHEFDNVGHALSISMVQLQRYLEAADSVLDAAIAKTVAAPQAETKNANYAETREGETHIGKSWKQLPDGAVVFFRALGYPSGMLRTANVRQSGRYRIKVTGYAYQSEQPITFSIGATTFQRGAERPTFAYHAMPPGEPTTVEIEAWMEERYMVELTPWGIADEYNLIKQHGIDQYPGPGLAILNVELTGPLLQDWPSRGHRLLFDGLNREEVEPSNPALKRKSWYVPEFEIRSDNVDADAQRTLRRIATTVFRRPVTDQQLQPYLELFADQIQKSDNFEAALRSTVAALLCSPDFLYLQEGNGRLDDYALAARLSYFLTRTTPDTELLQAAAAGQLQTDEGIRQQLDRLLQDARFERFVADFADAWLNLRDLEFTSPDRNLYPEFDPFLQFSMLQETRQFLAKLIREDRAVRELVKPDFAMLNNRLALHYGIDGVTGPEIRPVVIEDDDLRGGVLSQASVLKVSANGTNTSPVVRGVWVLERILGQIPPPPPPGISGVEPDVRGATTLRELLDRHRDLDSCRNCHAAIDPPGFALECFDPVGGYRDRFRSLGEGDRVDIRVNGRKVRYRLGPPVDASGQLPTGESFAGYRQFRELLVQQERRLAKALLTKLLTFATGHEPGFSDREALERLTDQAAQKEYGIRSMIELVVLSDIFRTR